MKNFFNKQREIIAIIVYIALIAIISFGLIKPLLAKINGTRDRIQEESLKQQAEKDRLMELPKIKQQYGDIESNENLETVLLDRNNAVGLIEGLEKLASETNNKIEISVQENQNIKGAVKNKSQDNLLINSLPSTEYLQLKLSLTGKYNTIADFIAKLENWTYYSDIIDLDFKSSVDNDTNKQGSSSGITNPFDPQRQANKPQVNVAGGSQLDATMDVVFYALKKN